MPERPLRLAALLRRRRRLLQRRCRLQRQLRLRSDRRHLLQELYDGPRVQDRADLLRRGVRHRRAERYAVRGYREGVQFGDRVASGSIEYRFPLALVGRGYGLWPVLLDKLSASVFLDAGSAWFDSGDIDVIASTGTELSIDLGFNYSVVYRFRLGFALPFDKDLGDPTLYVATGVAF